MMRGGNATIGTWLQFPSADVAEVMGASGYDWVAVDMEHGAFTRAILPDVFRAIERGGSTPFARIAQAELRPIKDALDSGAQGLVFPMIESREQLDRAISLSLYPDAGGSRGVGYSRANMYGRDFDPYRVDVAKDILLVAQIEHIRAVEQLDAVEDRLLEALTTVTESADASCTLMVVRLCLQGRTPLDSLLRRPETCRDLRERLHQAPLPLPVHIKDLCVETAPAVDMAACLQRQDLLGEALRLAEGLEQQPEALAAFAEEELAPLFRHCPAGMLDMPEGEDLQDLLDEARYLCLDMLEGK